MPPSFSKGRIGGDSIEKLGGMKKIKTNLFGLSDLPYNNNYPKISYDDIQNIGVKQTLRDFKTHEFNINDAFKIAKLKKDGILKVIVQPDTHVPEQDKKATAAFKSFISFYKPHAYINLGDFMEMESVSQWSPRTAKPRRLIPDAMLARQEIAETIKAAGEQCKIRIFIKGNHEQWLEDYLVNRIPEVYDGLEDVADLSVSGLLGLKQLGFEKIIPLNEIFKLGEAHFIHGYYTTVNHAKKHLDVFGCNIYYGHLHDVQCFTSVNVKSLHEAMSIGCLRNINAPFLRGRPNNWCHAFGIFEFRSDGTYTRYVPIIIDGKFSFNGVIF